MTERWFYYLKLRLPTGPDLFDFFKEKFYHASRIEVHNIDDFKRYPLNRFMYGKVVYRNDVVINDEVEQQIEEDIATAHKVALEKQKLIHKQQQDAMKIFIRIFGGDISGSLSPEMTDQKNPQTE